MKNELVLKIQRVLDSRITNEPKLVYLLVEVRKLMDRDGYQDPTLRMFCNWVVHTSLENRADGSTLILKEFDKWFADLKEHQKLSIDRKHISFGAFRESLMTCFEHFDLSATFTGGVVGWKKFFTLYSSIVSECPIVFTASRQTLKYIEKVELRGVARGILVKEWPMLQWKITLRDGSEWNWGFNLG